MDEYLDTNKELYGEYKEKKVEYDQLKEKEQEIKENFGQDKVEEALDERIKKMEKKVKKVKKEDLDVDDFIEDYREAKKGVLRYQLMKQKIFAEAV
mmetsp:Transcript_17039/g.19034  ORF Transcript_17039/g.19034 Transcript_17039/m.19034 type:complete len:96 (-) Transcript_17039:7-294(-)